MRHFSGPSMVHDGPPWYIPERPLKAVDEAQQDSMEANLGQNSMDATLGQDATAQTLSTQLLAD